MNKVITQFIKSSKKYQKDIEYYNYPGKVFYCSGSFEWCSYQMLDYYYKAPPFTYVFIKDGSAVWEIPSGIGPSQKRIGLIEKEGTKWIKADRRKINKILLMTEKQLKNKPVKHEKKLVEYLNDLNWSYQLLLKSNIPLQITVFINDPLIKKIKRAFGRNFDVSTILETMVADEKSDTAIHEEKLASLLRWLKSRKKIRITPSDYSRLLDNPEFRNKLQGCFETGYFLSSGYGGVELWSLKKEFLSLIKKSVSKETYIELPTVKNFTKFTKEQKLWVQAAKHFSWMRDKRRGMQQKIFYYQAEILEQIAKIIGVKRSELEHLRVEQFTEDNFKYPKKLKQIINKQKDGFVYCWEEINQKQFMINGGQAVTLNTKYSNFLQLKTQEIYGQVAQKGCVVGRVKIVLNPKNNVNFKIGEILVTGMTSPDFVPLIKKCSAIITEGGGITCHAAIIAREMNKPCIIGTKIATKVFKDGDLVEVDANKGIVRKLK